MTTKTLAAAVVLMVALALMACTQTSESAKIGQDGKGKVTIRTVVNKQMADGLMGMLKEMNMGMGSASDLFAQLDPESIKKRVEGKKGIKILSTSKVEDEEKGTLTVTVQIAFDSLELLYASGAITGVTAKLEKQADGNYKFTREFFKDRLPGADNPEGMAMYEGILMMLEPYLTDLEFSAEMVLPTGVVKTSGEKVTENHVRWVIKYPDLMKPDKRTQTVVFTGAGLDWKPFDIGTAGEKAPPEEKPAGPTTPSEDPTPPEEKPAPDADKPAPDDDKSAPDDEK